MSTTGCAPARYGKAGSSGGAGNLGDNALWKKDRPHTFSFETRTPNPGAQQAGQLGPQEYWQMHQVGRPGYGEGMSPTLLPPPLQQWWQHPSTATTAEW